eukprot:3294203-Prymnesium_polylepis.1
MPVPPRPHPTSLLHRRSPPAGLLSSSRSSLARTTIHPASPQKCSSRAPTAPRTWASACSWRRPRPPSSSNLPIRRVRTLAARTAAPTAHAPWPHSVSSAISVERFLSDQKANRFSVETAPPPCPPPTGHQGMPRCLREREEGVRQAAQADLWRAARHHNHRVHRGLGGVRVPRLRGRLVQLDRRPAAALGLAQDGLVGLRDRARRDRSVVLRRPAGFKPSALA